MKVIRSKEHASLGIGGTDTQNEYWGVWSLPTIDVMSIGLTANNASKAASNIRTRCCDRCLYSTACDPDIRTTSVDNKHSGLIIRGNRARHPYCLIAKFVVCSKGSISDV